MNRYRFDDAYGKVYEYDEDAKAYFFVGSYLAFGITKRMSEDEMIRRVDDSPGFEN